MIWPFSQSDRQPDRQTRQTEAGRQAGRQTHTHTDRLVRGETKGSVDGRRILARHRVTHAAGWAGLPRPRIYARREKNYCRQLTQHHTSGRKRLPVSERNVDRATVFASLPGDEPENVAGARYGIRHTVACPAKQGGYDHTKPAPLCPVFSSSPSASDGVHAPLAAAGPAAPHRLLEADAVPGGRDGRQIRETARKTGSNRKQI